MTTPDHDPIPRTWGWPIGSPASVSAAVRCEVSWTDLGLPGAPGSRPVASTFTSGPGSYATFSAPSAGGPARSWSRC